MEYILFYAKMTFLAKVQYYIIFVILGVSFLIGLLMWKRSKGKVQQPEPVHPFIRVMKSWMEILSIIMTMGASIVALFCVDARIITTIVRTCQTACSLLSKVTFSGDLSADATRIHNVVSKIPIERGVVANNSPYEGELKTAHDILTRRKYNGRFNVETLYKQQELDLKAQGTKGLGDERVVEQPQPRVLMYELYSLDSVPVYYVYFEDGKSEKEKLRDRVTGVKLQPSLIPEDAIVITDKSSLDIDQIDQSFLGPTVDAIAFSWFTRVTTAIGDAKTAIEQQRTFLASLSSLLVIAFMVYNFFSKKKIIEESKAAFPNVNISEMARSLAYVVNDKNSNSNNASLLKIGGKKCIVTTRHGFTDSESPTGMLPLSMIKIDVDGKRYPVIKIKNTNNKDIIILVSSIPKSVARYIPVVKHKDVGRLTHISRDLSGAIYSGDTPYSVYNGQIAMHKTTVEGQCGSFYYDSALSGVIAIHHAGGNDGTNYGWVLGDLVIEEEEPICLTETRPCEPVAQETAPPVQKKEMKFKKTVGTRSKAARRDEEVSNRERIDRKMRDLEYDRERFEREYQRSLDYGNKPYDPSASWADQPDEPEVILHRLKDLDAQIKVVSGVRSKHDYLTDLSERVHGDKHGNRRELRDMVRNLKKRWTDFYQTDFKLIDQNGGGVIAQVGMVLGGWIGTMIMIHLFMKPAKKDVFRTSMKNVMAEFDYMTDKESKCILVVNVLNVAYQLELSEDKIAALAARLLEGEELAFSDFSESNNARLMPELLSLIKDATMKEENFQQSQKAVGDDLAKENLVDSKQLCSETQQNLALKVSETGTLQQALKRSPSQQFLQNRNSPLNQTSSTSTRRKQKQKNQLLKKSSDQRDTGKLVCENALGKGPTHTSETNTVSTLKMPETASKPGSQHSSESQSATGGGQK